MYVVYTHIRLNVLYVQCWSECECVYVIHVIRVPHNNHRRKRNENIPFPALNVARVAARALITHASMAKHTQGKHERAIPPTQHQPLLRAQQKERHRAPVAYHAERVMFMKGGLFVVNA